MSASTTFDVAVINAAIRCKREQSNDLPLGDERTQIRCEITELFIERYAIRCRKKKS